MSEQVPSSSSSTREFYFKAINKVSIVGPSGKGRWGLVEDKGTVEFFDQHTRYFAREEKGQVPHFVWLEYSSLRQEGARCLGLASYAISDFEGHHNRKLPIRPVQSS